MYYACFVFDPDEGSQATRPQSVNKGPASARKATRKLHAAGRPRN
jgi:hypothetical protein